MKKISVIKSKKYVIYAKKDLVLMMIIKSIIKSEIIAHDICNLRHKTLKEIPLVFHSVWTKITTFFKRRVSIIL